MNNEQINKLLRGHWTTRNIFVSVHAIDTLPRCHRDDLPAAYVANTAPSYESGEHWIAYYFPISGSVEYFDSFGEKPSRESLLFLQSKPKINNMFLQNPMSTACGQYVIFYIWCRASGIPMNRIVKKLHSMGGKRADDYVNHIVENIFGMDLDVFDEKFVKKQIARSFHEQWK